MLNHLFSTFSFCWTLVISCNLASLYRYAFQIVLQARDLLRSMPSLEDVNVPNSGHFTVCGDVHGQVSSVTSIFIHNKS
jgi:hypothetical protein